MSVALNPETGQDTPVYGYSVKEAAEKLRVSQGLIYSQIVKGRLHCLRAGTKIIIPGDELDRWLRLPVKGAR